MTDVIRTTRAAYDAIASEYAGRWRDAPAWAVAEADRLAALLPPGARVADVGCGPGHHVRLLTERGLRACGFDLSHRMLTAGGAAGDLAQADMRALPVGDVALDAVWCAAALLHLPREQAPSALAEFARVLRPGGELVLAVAEGDGEGWEASPYAAPGHRWFVLHRLEPLRDLLEAAGFTVTGVSRRTSHRDWLTLRAHRAEAGATPAAELTASSGAIAHVGVAPRSRTDVD